MLKEIGMIGARNMDTPIKINLKLQISEGEQVSNKANYQYLIEKLIYLTTTRPDITYSVNKLSQFT